MTTPLLPIIIDKIKSEGPLEIGQYMDMAMGHPEHGYYVTRDPLGNEGDFTTAPEISQMFGELIGAFFIFQWEHFGKPKKLSLLECGPGKGTLMADMMRVITHSSEEMSRAVTVHLVEISPVLRERQAQMLSDYAPVWHDDLSSVPEDAPIFMIGNEFLDVLPFRQFVKMEQGWHERFVDYDEARGLHFTAAPSRDGMHDSLSLPFSEDKVPEDEVFEQAPAREGFVKALCAKMKAARGAALLIDYGYLKSDVGDSFQALKDKKSCDVLEHVGEADLTSQVNFQCVQEAAQGVGANIGKLMGPPATQGTFLKMMHIDARLEMIRAEATEEEMKDIMSGYHRLVDPKEMGDLFKVIEFGYDPETL